jgi:hypothetical protein
MRVPMTLIALAAVAVPASAQEAPPAADSSRRVPDILNLPQVVEAARRAGIPSGKVGEVLDSLRRRRVPAEDAGQILRGETEKVQAGEPKENFGAFVQEQLARGLRGRELADAIHAEHARRGVGKARGGAGADRAAPGRGRGATPDTTRGRGRRNP